jgi:poly-gamma-glutamate capsule biosynthesis protein CapA/YwtB (metallophosphatase superfamily)
VPDLGNSIPHARGVCSTSLTSTKFAHGTNLLIRRHPNIAAVALANKNARTVWAMLAHGREFRADYVPTRMAA